ncbi:MAG: ectonucleotide pyrophosphatase/phosphodiesterase [Bryobacteraceae bacterium]
MRKLLMSLLGLAAIAHGRSLLVISIDGLDNRYLRDADKMGLKIPAIRRLISEGAWAAGVVGVMPSVTFPSHTTMVTGVLPHQHGIINNNDGNNVRYWYTRQIKAPLLWDAAHASGLKTGAVDWPVTVGANIDFNFPEKFSGGDAGRMEMAAHEDVSTPGLIQQITAMFPSFPRPIVDDRARTQAVLYMLKRKADLILVHLADHDAAAHAHGPYGKPANATLELADECVGMMMGALPKDGVIALVSDHGFERVDRLVNPKAYSTGEMTVSSTLVTTRDPEVAAALRGKDGIGREIPQGELSQRSAGLAGLFAFAPVEHVNFGSGQLASPKGSHGYWPVRDDYRSVYVLWGAGVKRERLPEIEMTSIAGRLAVVLGLRFP